MTGLIPGWRARALAAPLCIAALLAACAEAPPSPLATGATPETLGLAKMLMQRVRFDHIMDESLGKLRNNVVTNILEDKFHKPPAEAERDADQVIIPEIRSEIPEVQTQAEEIAANLFTADELHAMLNDDNQSPAAASAKAKLPELRKQMGALGRQWGQTALRDTLHTHAAELGIPALAFSPPGLTQ